MTKPTVFDIASITGWVPDNYISPFDDPFSPLYGMTPEQYAEMTGLDTGNAVPYTTPLGGWTGTLAPNAATPEALANYAQYEEENQSFREENSWFDPAMLALMGGLTAGAATGLIGGGSAAGGLTPITVSATPLAGGVPAVEAATAAGLAGTAGMAAFPTLTGAAATLPAASLINAGGTAGGILDSSGTTIPGTAPITPATGAAAGATSPLGNVANTVGNTGGPPVADSGASSFLGNLRDWLPFITDTLGGLLQHRAADQAVGAQKEEIDKAIGIQNESQEQALGYLRPYEAAGKTALERLVEMTTPGSNFQIGADPGYQFRVDQAIKQLQSSAAAKGGLLSGGFAKNAIDIAGQYASQEYQNIYNRLSNIVNYGMGAAGNMANISTTRAANIGNLLTNRGEARASGYVAQGNVLADTATTLGGYTYGNGAPQSPFRSSYVGG